MHTTPELPGKAQALVRALKLAYRAEPRLLVVSFFLVTTSFIPDALGALWLKFLAQGVVEARATLITWAAVGLAASGALAWLLRLVGERIQFLFRERATIAIESHVVRLQATVTTIEHHERPEYLDRLQILRDQAFLLNHLYLSAMGTAGSLARVAITVGLLVWVHPALAILALFALPPIVTSSKRAGVERATDEGAAQYRRLARHLFDLGATAGPAKELRVMRIGALVTERRRAAWDAWFARVSVARWTSAAWHVAAWTLFGIAYVSAIVFTAMILRAPTGDVLLVLAAGANLSRYLGMTAAEAEFLRWCLDAAQRLAWLEDHARAERRAPDLPAPARLQRGIRLDHVSFRYPGTDKLVLEDIELELPAGTVVAIVGENGAGKTTLVKLLCRFHEPTSGRITVDGADLERIPADAWRARIAGTFQDFMRYEFLARTTIGLGDEPRMDNTVALEVAMDRGGARDVITRLPRQLDTQLGPAWEGGVELSWGQWQKLALARGFMRDDPLLLVLDEPTAALDAETEHALFERFAAQSRDTAHSSVAGRITVLVSHRFSTVRMADLIVVLDGTRVVEAGSHARLITRAGLYAELYDIQARAYR
ncbi:MAG: ABC transporter ATP-binding protein [Longimicrobiales bacterium]